MEPATATESVSKAELKGEEPTEEQVEEKESTEPTKPKHEKLQEDSKKEIAEVELIDNKYTKNVTSPFIS